ncbi:ribonuclease R [Williamsoniiplasma somnilux]|uniref:Ribonuclease R n=1 Tax=Williamsoniiplasma somnilux TaxID=215578 RepID=A0A2K8NZ65_9MOLU|nr:ribonuclease R [Williamsoniiplasma somnilux]ATZ19024.1 ribonuclease R [Williamsoniiplasma somnilux]
MKNEIIKYLQNNKNQLTMKIIQDKFGWSKETEKIINQLIVDQIIAINKNQINIFLLDNMNFHIGRIKTNPKGFGFVNDFKDLEKDDYFVPPVALNGSIYGDTIIYTIEKEKDERLHATVIDIVKREKEFVVGEIVQSKDGRFLDFIPTDLAFSNARVVMVNKTDFELKPNLLFKAKILEAKDRKLFVRLKKYVGDATKAADRILSIAEEFNIKTEFSKRTIENANEVNIPVLNQESEIKRRSKNSLINLHLVTIDGADSKDLDDSIYVERTNKGYKLIVAIADVSYYVKSKSPLDNEALMRGNSTYLANKVIPMLPKILSNDLCSLNPNTEKFAMACEMIFDNQGKMLSKKVYETIMISKARLTYDEVNNYFHKKEWSKDPLIAKMLNIALELNNLIDVIHNQRGTINIETREPKVIMDQDSNVLEINARTTDISEKLIENFMVSANEAVAELIFEKELPFIYRNHGRPLEEDLIAWYGTIKSFGIDPKLTDKEMLEPKNLNKTLMQINKQILDPVEKELLNISLLRHMDKAKYGLVNIGHFGLGSECYTHFTSPIRRYSDLMVHRYLKEYLLENKTDELTLEKNHKFIETASPIINDTEVQSVDCEREVVKVCMVEFLKDKIGNVYEGMISVALKFGFFVQLENMVEGLVHISTLGDGLTYDEKNYTLIRPDNTFYRMGQKVKIKVVNADIKTRKIDFELVK